MLSTEPAMEKAAMDDAAGNGGSRHCAVLPVTEMMERKGLGKLPSTSCDLDHTGRIPGCCLPGVQPGPLREPHRARKASPAPGQILPARGDATRSTLRAPGEGLSLHTGSDSPQMCSPIAGPSPRRPADPAGHGVRCHSPAHERSGAWHSGDSSPGRVRPEPAKTCSAGPAAKGVVCRPQELSL